MAKSKNPKIPLNLHWIGKEIQKFRKSANITQEKLAERIDVAVTTIQYIEQSRRLPSLQILDKICKELGLTLQIKKKN